MRNQRARAEQFSKESLSEQVQKSLRREIIEGLLKPEHRIDLNFYANEWGISSTPIRDALKQLEIDGFVNISPRRGVFVAKLDKKELREIFELRLAIECTAIQLATSRIPKDVAQNALDTYTRAREADNKTEKAKLLPRIDDLIHSLGIEYCNNRRLKRYWASNQDLIRWSRLTIIRNLDEPYAATLPEHIDICDAVVAREPARASEAMRIHLDNTIRRIEDYLN